MKRIIMLGISLLIILTLLVACNQDTGEITLESMKKTLQKSGYTIIENYTELYEPYEALINSIGGFSFVLPVDVNIITPVLEFQDDITAALYAESVEESGYYLAIVNGKFLTVMEAPHENERIFLENLINGKSIK